jgi:hypothetical protein
MRMSCSTRPCSRAATSLVIARDHVPDSAMDSGWALPRTGDPPDELVALADARAALHAEALAFEALRNEGVVGLRVAAGVRWIGRRRRSSTPLLLRRARPRRDGLRSGVHDLCSVWMIFRVALSGGAPQRMPP